MTIPPTEKVPEIPEESELLEETHEGLALLAQEMRDDDLLHVTPQDIVRAAQKHDISLEDIARITRRIPYQELAV